jgi:ribosomal-protein-alanine N-acetyltransferase
VLFLLEEAKGCARIDLVTHPDNAAAIALYGSLGFALESRKEDYFGDGEPRVVMQRGGRGVA